ncbi:2-C-methyl-D-erythritol 4-phosphate cytidylyltransferase [Jeotgalibacillus alimentarius]|uniref:2-C-methyl-D-erythritol 4-phosphate cytidylyltransferase n=1 Tax=Jeotgalibacillus alimentarius TaxID=135826 RepID=A0A0C2RTN7_9BACL|nr:2-C-methyl-D-erythritol 4-phosphate cytidylyltransferase [Jeotgalibacillus alimentarius]KIL53595.1 2-C-methyl-D-erythritol 4-phosphate cytidylyltransferase [Jeotgalibacillus alimentarius]
MTYEVVIPAAGRGKRMGADRNKLLLELKGIPVIVHTLQVFERDPLCSAVILVIHPDDKKTLEELIDQYHLTKITQMVTGGAERQHSVYEGLKKAAAKIVMVHDGARPFISQEVIHKLAEAAASKGGAIAAVPVKDTIKKVKNGTVTETVERSDLWSVQTPQAFLLEVLMGAHEEAVRTDFLGTDEASLVEKTGGKVAVIESDYDNIKLTTKEDLVFAEAILAKNGQ